MMTVEKDKTMCHVCGTMIDLVRMHKDEVDFNYPRRCPVCGAVVIAPKNIVERLLSIFKQSKGKL